MLVGYYNEAILVLFSPILWSERSFVHFSESNFRNERFLGNIYLNSQRTILHAAFKKGLAGQVVALFATNF